jgi:hypothetical protein
VDRDRHGARLRQRSQIGLGALEQLGRARAIARVGGGARRVGDLAVGGERREIVEGGGRRLLPRDAEAPDRSRRAGRARALQPRRRVEERTSSAATWLSTSTSGEVVVIVPAAADSGIGGDRLRRTLLRRSRRTEGFRSARAAE